MNQITIRKTLARFAYYASKSQEGIEHKTILESLDFTQDDFQYMIEQSIEIANNETSRRRISSQHQSASVFRKNGARPRGCRAWLALEQQYVCSSSEPI